MTNLSVDFLEFTAAHPAIVVIAVDLILNPEHRERYPALVLSIAEHSISVIKSKLIEPATAEI